MTAVTTLLRRLCGGLAALALFALMLLTLVDVLGRKLASHSLPGALELTELLLVVVIFSALPLVSLSGEHVVFESLDRFLGPRARRLQQAVIQALCALGMLGLGWLMWGKSRQLAEYGDTTPQLALPLAPMVAGMALLCGVTALVHAMLALRPSAPSVAAAGVAGDAGDALPGGGGAT